MAYFGFGFTDKYFAGEPIRIFNNGNFENDLYRDFTYIDDVVEGVVRVLEPVDMKLLDEALIRVDKAIEKDEYAKFYATKDRLKLIKGEYDEAKKDLNKAIDLEENLCGIIWNMKTF